MVIMPNIQKLKRRIDLKAVLLTVLADDMKEASADSHSPIALNNHSHYFSCQLVDEMTAMYQAHLKLLERMQLKAQADEFSASQQDKVAEEVKKIWMSAIRRFKKGGAIVDSSFVAYDVIIICHSNKRAEGHFESRS